jgi:2-isopropylmalate synthase
LISELSGKSNILAKIDEFKIDKNLVNDEKIKKILGIIKEKENNGYQFE